MIYTIRLHGEQWLVLLPYRKKVTSLIAESVCMFPICGCWFLFTVSLSKNKHE